jgi:hypothetical protein
MERLDKCRRYGNDFVGSFSIIVMALFILGLYLQIRV